MPKLRIERRIKKRLLLNAEELFGALGVDLSEEQRMTAERAEASHARQRVQVLAWQKEHRDLCNERMNAHRAANREKINARARELRDPEKEKERRKRYYYQTEKARRQENKEAHNAYERERYQKKREQKIAACKAYRDAYRDEINARRRARYDPEKEAERGRRKRESETPEQQSKRLERYRRYRERARFVRGEASAESGGESAVTLRGQTTSSSGSVYDRGEQQGATIRANECAPLNSKMSDQHRKICVTENAKKGITHENQRRNDGRGI